MSSDLSAFFAKKNDKRKKNAVVKMDDVGQILERRAKKQEEHDREVDEEDKRNGGEEDREQGEDSEWIEYDNSNPAGRLDGLNLRDMGAETENTEEEHIDVAEQKEQHETRTWGQVDKKEEKDVQTAAEMAAYQKAQSKPNVFVPTALRNERSRADANIDVTSQEMFPSLADASKMETAKKEDSKTGGGWMKTGQSENRPVARAGWGSAPSGPPNTGRDREAALAATKAMLNQMTSSTPPAPVRPVEEPQKTPSGGAYIPPHLRNRNN